jgi:hypothetical protein
MMAGGLWTSCCGLSISRIRRFPNGWRKFGFGLAVAAKHFETRGSQLVTCRAWDRYDYVEVIACAEISKRFCNFDPPVTENEVRAASLQFVRKICGSTKPLKANEDGFVEFHAMWKELKNVNDEKCD